MPSLDHGSDAESITSALGKLVGDKAINASVDGLLAKDAALGEAALLQQLLSLYPQLSETKEAVIMFLHYKLSEEHRWAETLRLNKEIHHHTTKNLPEITTKPAGKPEESVDAGGLTAKQRAAYARAVKKAQAESDQKWKEQGEEIRSYEGDTVLWGLDAVTTGVSKLTTAAYNNITTAFSSASLKDLKGVMAETIQHATKGELVIPNTMPSQRKKEPSSQHPQD